MAHADLLLLVPDCQRSLFDPIRRVRRGDYDSPYVSDQSKSDLLLSLEDSLISSDTSPINFVQFVGSLSHSESQHAVE